MSHPQNPNSHLPNPLTSDLQLQLSLCPKPTTKEQTLNTQTTSTEVHLDQIAQIALTVQDLERAKHFYRDILGLKFLFYAGTMAFFQVGPIRLMLGLAEKPTTPSGTILYFKLPNLEAAHALLVSQGVAFLQAPHLVAKMPDHDLWMAFLNDTEGNTLGLMSELPRP